MAASRKCVSLFSVAFVLFVTSHSYAQVPRIQVGKWVDPPNKIEDPLNEIVSVRYFKDDKFLGTGTLLNECRVIGAVHVLLNMIHGDPDHNYMTNPNESLVGEKFDFVTNPVADPNGKTQRAIGSFVVLGHGKPKEKELSLNAEEDWFVGFDPDCLGDRLKLGYVIPINGQRLDSMQTRTYMTAGHSHLPAARNSRGEYELYIDSKCNVTDAEYVNDSYIMTNCSFWNGGSGQLLMTLARKRGEIQMGPGGHPIKLAHAIFQGVEEHLDLKVPNIKGASGVAPFTYDLWNKIHPFLEGPVDTAKLAQIALARKRTP